jgi:hypothetical protein
MKLWNFAMVRGLILGSLGLCGLVVGCKDEDPCDPGQIETSGQCYSAPASGGSSSGDDGGADAGGGAVDAAGGAPSAALETAFGTPCLDTAASSDCAGVAPVCADLSPLGQTIMCTQIDCSPGAANAGVCPSEFTCFAPPGYPSVCIKK